MRIAERALEIINEAKQTKKDSYGYMKEVEGKLRGALRDVNKLFTEIVHIDEPKFIDVLGIKRKAKDLDICQLHIITPYYGYIIQEGLPSIGRVTGNVNAVTYYVFETLGTSKNPKDYKQVYSQMGNLNINDVAGVISVTKPITPDTGDIKKMIRKAIDDIKKILKTDEILNYRPGTDDFTIWFIYNDIQFEATVYSDGYAEIWNTDTGKNVEGQWQECLKNFKKIAK